jgi:hypothetical protein
LIDWSWKFIATIKNSPIFSKQNPFQLHTVYLAPLMMSPKRFLSFLINLKY